MTDSRFLHFTPKQVKQGDKAKQPEYSMQQGVEDYSLENRVCAPEEEQPLIAKEKHQEENAATNRSKQLCRARQKRYRERKKQGKANVENQTTEQKQQHLLPSIQTLLNQKQPLPSTLPTDYRLPNNGYAQVQSPQSNETPSYSHFRSFLPLTFHFYSPQQSAPALNQNTPQDQSAHLGQAIRNDNARLPSLADQNPMAQHPTVSALRETTKKPLATMPMKLFSKTLEQSRTGSLRAPIQSHSFGKSNKK